MNIGSLHLLRNWYILKYLVYVLNHHSKELYIQKNQHACVHIQLILDNLQMTTPKNWPCLILVVSHYGYK
jgi:hypothetical protein